MDLPEANSTTVCDLYCLRAACPCLSWSTVAVRVLTCCFRSSSFMLTLRSAVALRRHWVYCMHETTRGSRMFSLHEIFKCGHLKFTVYGHKQADIHTHNFRKCSHTSVGLAQARPNYTWFHKKLEVGWGNSD